MAINKNHEFEELNGVKCAIVEKNVTKQRADFLEQLLALNGYSVIIISAVPAKAAPQPVAAGEGPEPLAEAPAPEFFTIGVTDVMFNPTNAVFGRLLKTADGRVVTLAYWRQQEQKADDSVPYFEKNL